jgi:uncharacterized protein with HEPN domain
MNEKDRRTVETIISYCNRLEQHMAACEYDKDIYMSNILYKDACALVIIQIGEFAGRLSDEFREEYDGVEWRQLIGLRNIMAHNYEDIIDHIVWTIIQDEIPEIKAYLESILVD